MDDFKLHGSRENDIDSLVRSGKIVSGDIGMNFGMDKCAVLKMKIEIQVQFEGIDLGEGIVK